MNGFVELSSDDLIAVEGGRLGFREVVELILLVRDGVELLVEVVKWVKDNEEYFPDRPSYWGIN